MQLGGCAFDKKAEERIMNMKPNFFNVSYALLLKLVQNESILKMMV